MLVFRKILRTYETNDPYCWVCTLRILENLVVEQEVGNMEM